VVVDTLRADHLGAYGWSRDTSPNLDRLAAEGELYRHAFAQAPWTLPAVASILTGQLPQVHGGGRGVRGFLYPVRPGIPILAEELQSAGFRTGAVVNVEFLRPESGLSRGFDHYDAEYSSINQGGRNAAETTDAALHWLDEVGTDPFFLLVHYFDPHLTYDPPVPFDTMFDDGEGPSIPPGFGSEEQVHALRDGRLVLDESQRRSLVARYDGEIRYTDEEFGRLRREMERRDLWENTLVIVVGDHGEEFWEHGGFEHGHSHHHEVLHVPLILRRPSGSPSIREERVRQLDIFPTVLDAAALEIPDDTPGLVLGDGASSRSIAAGSLWAGYLLSIRDDDGTLILDEEADRRWFYGPDDPLELGPQPPPAGAADTVARLDGVLRSLPPPSRDPAWELTEEERERLRSLGYVVD
jgi:arylsulfatase A-like enzyme